MKKKIACVTGASSGIGEETVLKLAEHGYSIIAIARREDKLKKLKRVITKRYKSEVITIPLDVQNQKEVKMAFEKLPKSWQAIDVLVNNAGLALGRVPIQDANPADWDVMIDTNLKGLLYVTHAILPFLIKRQRGHIVNIGSIAGKEMYPNGNVYAMTKHAVVALSDGMRIDLLPHNIRVTTINPGHVKTEFALVRYKGDQKK